VWDAAAMTQFVTQIMAANVSSSSGSSGARNTCSIQKRQKLLLGSADLPKFALLSDKLASRSYTRLQNCYSIRVVQL